MADLGKKLEPLDKPRFSFFNRAYSPDKLSPRPNFDSLNPKFSDSPVLMADFGKKLQSSEKSRFSFFSRETLSSPKSFDFVKPNISDSPVLMADSEKKLESLEKTRFSFFSRGSPPEKLAPPASLDRTSSLAKLYDSIESVRSTSSSIKGKVRRLCSIFESAPVAETPKISKLKPSKKSSESSFLNSSTLRLPDTEDRIVVFTTSLRGVRRTYDDCYAVRTIFRGLRVRIDERDVSMDSSFRRELQGVLGDKNAGLPQVFIGGSYVGGAEVVRQLFESGELVKILEEFPVQEPGFVVCEVCGDARFIPCTNCSGSRKVFDEDEEVMKRCLECNENGLVRCSGCGY